MVAKKKVVVDANVWSKYMRWKTVQAANQQIVDELRRLLQSSQAVLIGLVRQEVLSGISDTSFFESLKERMAIVADTPVLPDDHIRAAEFSNACRVHGIQGSPTDFLICAVAVRNDWEIFTEDSDFQLYCQHIPIALHEVTVDATILPS